MARPVDLLLTALAAHRVTRLVTTDSITDPLRQAIFDRWPPTLQRAGQRWNGELGLLVHRPADETWPRPRKVTAMLDCPWCAGFWISAAFVFGRRIPNPLLTTFALSSVVGLIGAADAALA